MSEQTQQANAQTTTIQVNNISFDLNKEVLGLLRNEPFYAGISRYITKIPDRNLPAIMGIGFSKSKQLTLYYHPDLCSQLDSRQIATVLKHEIAHVLFEHLTKRKPEKFSQVHNIAMDLAINSFYEKDFLEGTWPYEVCLAGHGPFKDLPRFKNYEWYLANLPKNEQGEGEQGDGQNGQGGGSGKGSIDDHSRFGDGLTEEDQKILEKQLQGFVDNVARECQRSQSWGSIPSEIKEKLVEGLNAGKVSWRDVLQTFVHKTISADRYQTYRRPNRRVSEYPGTRRNYTARILVAIDQSGSVDDNLLALLFSEISTLSEVVSFSTVHFDCTVDESSLKEYAKGSVIEPSRTRSGGTEFDPACSFAVENGFDAVIVCTDMFAEKPSPITIDRVWVTQTPPSSHFQTDETVVYLEAE